MANVAVVLSGCGYLDGAEVQEAVFTLLFLDRAGHRVTCFAPDRDQMHVVDHQSGDVQQESRNVRIEAARITRGNVAPLTEADLDDFDALVMPGGYGVAKNLSSFATEGTDATVDPDLARLIGQARDGSKPIVAICIAPAVMALALRDKGGATLTIGNDADTATALESLGSTHCACASTEVAVDDVRKIVSTPAYMLQEGPAAVAQGIERAIAQLNTWLQP